MGRALRFVPLMMLACSAVACGAESEAPPAYESAGPRGGAGGSGDVVLGPDGMPVGPDGKPLPAKLDGVYELSNVFDLTSAGVFPDVANDTLKALSNFKEHPSQTLVDLMAVAGVPVVPQVLNAIPALIRDYVLGYIDEHVVGALYDKVPFAKNVTIILDDLATITTKFELVTTLDLQQANAYGDVFGSHRFKGVAWNWQNKRNLIEAPAVIKDIETMPVKANAVSLEKRSPELESARLRVGDHTFTVPIGSFALIAADQIVKDKFGAANLRDAIGKVVNCEVVADAVSKRCIDPPGPGRVCVDHKPEIKNLCNTGLDVLVGVLQGQIKALDLPLLKLEEGNAQMWDAPVKDGPLDATIDRIERGFWTASVNVGKEPKAILATFTGRRVGDTAMPSR